MFTTTLNILRQSFALFSAQRASRLAAALAFYSLISLAPLLIVAVGAINLIYDDIEARQQLIDTANEQLSSNVAATVVSIVEGIGESSGGGLATLIGILGAALGASNVFNQLQDILNRLWGIDEPKKPFLKTVRERGLAFLMVFGFGFLLILIMIAQAALAALGELLPTTILRFNWLPIASFGFSLVLMTLLFGLIYRVLPDTAVGWRDALSGGLVTALLFRVGLTAIRWYVEQSAAGAAYGVAGSLLVTLLIIYYISMIFLFGAAVTRNINLALNDTKVAD